MASINSSPILPLKPESGEEASKASSKSSKVTSGHVYKMVKGTDSELKTFKEATDFIQKHEGKQAEHKIQQLKSGRKVQVGGFEIIPPRLRRESISNQEDLEWSKKPDRQERRKSVDDIGQMKW